MTLIAHITNRLVALGVSAEIRGNRLVIDIDGITSKLRFDDDMQEKFDAYRRARKSVFDTADWSYIRNSIVEVPLARLDPDVYRDSDEINFTDRIGNSVTVQRATFEYMLAHFDSTDYEAYFDRLVTRRLTRLQVTYSRNVNILFRSPVTAIYTARGRRSPENLHQLALERIRSCLAKLAIERHACYEIVRPKVQRALGKLDIPTDSDWAIPKAVYEPNLVSYYKVARSSPFPSQSFLAYYHVLEYYFLRVAEDALHHQLRTQLNRSDFKANSDGLDRVIALVRRQGSTDDETELLRKVLQRFIAEDDFISHVVTLENVVGEKLYTKRRTIFGESLEISLKEGHAISNAAKVLKHIRNAIVHSSDRYKREDCHIPLTESEETIGDFIPVIKYFAEQVIYGTGSPTQF
jgi:hypothetical protein